MEGEAPSRARLSVGRQIRAEREAQSLTQHTLAQRSGVGIGTIRDLEQGRTSRPRRVTLEAVLTALGLPPQRVADLTSNLPQASSRPVQDGDGETGQVNDPNDVGVMVLGETAVVRGTRRERVTARTQRLLITRLALDAGRSVSRDELFRAAWERDREADDDHILHTAIGRVRKLIAPVQVHRTPLGYLLEATAEQADIVRFRELVKASGRADTPHGRLELLVAAFALWSEFPGGLGRWASEPLQIWTDYRSAACSAASAAREVGHAATALAPLRNAIAISPFDEALHAELILTLAASGRQAEALAAFQALRTALVEEIGFEPGELVQRAHQEVLAETVVTADRVAGAQVPRQTPAPPWTVVGRDAELEALMKRHGAPHLNAQPMVTVVSGPAGVGKTALVLEGARRLADTYPDGTLFLDAKGTGTTVTLARAVETLHRAIDPDALPKSDVDQAAADLRTILAGRRVLVVLDNLRDASILHAVLPSVGQSSLIATSRWDLTDAGVDVRLSLDVLEPDGAVELLGAAIGQRVLDDVHAARAIAEHCGRLPLALAITAARLAARPSLPLDRMASLLEDDNARLDELSTSRSSVDASLAASYVLLHRDARKLLRALSLHRADRIHGDYAAAVLPHVDQRSVHRAVEELLGANLLTEYADGSMQLHELTRLHAARELDDHERALVDRAIDGWHRTTTRRAMDAIYPYLVKLDPRPGAEATMTAEEAFAWIGQEESGLVRTVELAAADPDRRRLAVELADELRGYFMVRRHIDEWTRVVTAGLSAAEALGDPAQVAAMLLGRAQLAEATGRDNDAMTDSLRAFRLAAAADWQEAAAYLAHSIGWMYSLQGHLDDAEEWYGQATARSRTAGSGHVEAMVLNALGLLRSYQARYSESRDLLERAIAMNKIHKRHASILVNRGNLARTLRALGEVDEAQTHLDEVLLGFRDRGDLRGQASTLDEIAQVHTSAGRVEAALHAVRQAMRTTSELSDTRLEGRLSCTLGETFLSADDLASAAYWFNHARTLAVSLPYPGLDLRARIGSARTAARNGDAAGARHLARGALTSARLLGHGELELAAEAALAEIGDRPRNWKPVDVAERGRSVDRPPSALPAT